MSIVLIIFQGCLIVYCLALIWFVLGLLRSDPDRTEDQPNVSVIIAARNGWPQLSLLLPRLLNQDYPADKLEVVIVDDGLSAKSRSMLEDFAASDSRVKIVHSSSGDQSLAYKKRALDAGIRSSSGELLLFTDVDCYMGPGWVSGTVSYFTPGIDYVVGWSQVGMDTDPEGDLDSEETASPVSVFERLDFTLLMLAARGAAMMGTPWASSGQNQAYRRDVYEQVGGFSKLADRLQGDDSLFLQVARRQAKARVTFACDADCRVITNSVGSTGQLLLQRIRWAGDALAMLRFNPAFFPIPLATFGVNALVIILAFAAITDSATVLPVLIPGILIKALVEVTFLLFGTSRVSLGTLKRHFPLWFLMQIPYITIVGLASFWGNLLSWRQPAGDDSVGD